MCVVWYCSGTILLYSLKTQHIYLFSLIRNTKTDDDTILSLLKTDWVGFVLGDGL